MVELQGGDPRVIDDTQPPSASAAHDAGIEREDGLSSTSMQCEQIGTACVILGGGRERKEDSVDPAVGIVLHKKVGDAVAPASLSPRIYYNAESHGGAGPTT